MGELRRVVVLGGAGAVGQLLVRLLRAAGADVRVADLAPGADLPGDVTAPTADLRAALARADGTVLALHEQVAIRAVTAVGGLIAADSVLVETTSVKHRIAAAVGRHVRGPALGINPMFAPDLPPAGRSVAAVTHREGPGVAAVLGLLAATGVQVIAMDAEEHDRAMAAVQVAVHASVLAFGRALSRLGVDAGRLDAVGTPPYATLLAVLARVLGGEPAVYRDIQRANPYGRAARAELSRALRAVARAVDSDDDAAFTAELNAIAAFLGTRAAPARDHCARLFTITPHSDPAGPHDAPTGR